MVIGWNLSAVELVLEKEYHAESDRFEEDYLFSGSYLDFKGAANDLFFAGDQINFSGESKLALFAVGREINLAGKTGNAECVVEQREVAISSRRPDGPGGADAHTTFRAGAIGREAYLPEQSIIDRAIAGCR